MVLVNGNRECRNIDECAQAMDTCSRNAQCQDTPGGYTCQCNTGYVGDGYACSSECIVISYSQDSFTTEVFLPDTVYYLMKLVYDWPFLTKPLY